MKNILIYLVILISLGSQNSFGKMNGFLLCAGCFLMACAHQDVPQELQPNMAKEKPENLSRKREEKLDIQEIQKNLKLIEVYDPEKKKVLYFLDMESSIKQYLALRPYIQEMTHEARRQEITLRLKKMYDELKNNGKYFFQRTHEAFWFLMTDLYLTPDHVVDQEYTLKRVSYLIGLMFKYWETNNLGIHEIMMLKQLYVVLCELLEVEDPHIAAENLFNNNFRGLLVEDSI